MPAVAVPIIMGVVGAAATVHSANKQSAAQKAAIAQQIAEDKRRRKPFKATAVDLSKLFSGDFSAANGAYAGFEQASPMYGDAASWLRTMLNEDPAAAQSRLLQGTSDATNQWFQGTQASADIGRNKLIQGITSGVAGNYGNRAGTAPMRLAGEGINEFEANRWAQAANLTPAFMSALMGQEGQRLQAAQMGLGAGQDWLANARAFATQQPTQAPFLPNQYAGAAGASTLNGIAQAGQAGYNIYQNYQNQQQMNQIMNQLASQQQLAQYPGTTVGPFPT
jgi:hypothetical protein